MWISKGAALIRERCLIEAWRLLEEMRYLKKVWNFLEWLVQEQSPADDL